LIFSVSASRLELEILSLDPSELSQRIREGPGQRMRALAQQTDPIDPLAPLRLGGEWRGEEAEGDAADEPSSVYHSIT
jgi:hypothetical protein